MVVVNNRTTTTAEPSTPPAEEASTSEPVVLGITLPVAPVEAYRYYSVFSAPAPTTFGGAGVYYGSFPGVWRFICAQGHNPDTATLAGSGIQLRRCDSLSQAINLFIQDATTRGRTELRLVFTR